MVAVITAAVVIALVVVILVGRSRRANDGVDSFRRQIDALSPEARRPVVDQVKGVTDRHTRDDEPVADEHDDPDDEGGLRGA